MASVQMMCARIGMVSGRGLTAALKVKFPRWLVATVITALQAKAQSVTPSDTASLNARYARSSCFRPEYGETEPAQINQAVADRPAACAHHSIRDRGEATK